MLFNKQVTEERYNKVYNEYYKLLDGWDAKQTNGDKLYKEARCSWQEVDMDKFTTIEWFDSWKDMPKKAIEYIKGIKEFDTKIFKEITGIDIDKKHIIKIDGKDIELSEESFKELQKSLLTQA